MSCDTARVALCIRAATLDRVIDRKRVLRNHAAALIGGVCAVYADLTGSRRRHDLYAALTDAQAELIRQLTAADVTLCVTLRPQGPQSDLEIRAVDELLVGVYRSLAGPQGAMWDLPAGPPAAGDAL